MQIDRKFFERVVQMLETDHMIIYKHQDELEVTEAWVAHVNNTIKQCKEVNEIEKYQEEVQALCTYWNDNLPGDLGGEDMYEIALQKTISIDELDMDIPDLEDEQEIWY